MSYSQSEADLVRENTRLRAEHGRMQAALERIRQLHAPMSSTFCRDIVEMVDAALTPAVGTPKRKAVSEDDMCICGEVIGTPACSENHDSSQ